MSQPSHRGWGPLSAEEREKPPKHFWFSQFLKSDCRRSRERGKGTWSLLRRHSQTQVNPISAWLLSAHWRARLASTQWGTERTILNSEAGSHVPLDDEYIQEWPVSTAGHDSPLTWAALTGPFIILGYTVFLVVLGFGLVCLPSAAMASGNF